MIKVSLSQPNYLTINPDGTVSADFSGIIHAQGLILQTATDQSAPETESEIQWINPAGDTVLQKYGGATNDPTNEEYFSTEHLDVPVGQAGRMTQEIVQNGLVTGIESYADTDANYTYVQAQAQDYTATILDSTNNSSFLRTPQQFQESVSIPSGGTIQWTINFTEGANKMLAVEVSVLQDDQYLTGLDWSLSGPTSGGSLTLNLLNQRAGTAEGIIMATVYTW